ncbi:SUKH-4 family immunity protein [Kitasatospora cineracea]|uniref:SUKH-4 immunity protein of toxin-antitoxin system n=1 Tax=Kitasatospora cineracea TaxID=88074 RepID=A0A3N4R623_9ACTN|nr:SUKH-4 family immunity protein [Kitasatospora cineracea]RPE28973.1 SUKH-4 immunity protein of toxin-antitoxin system [Kitasatospora cineracea]
MGTAGDAGGAAVWTAELPGAARAFLDGAGVGWEPSNDGAVRRFGRYVGEFADALEENLREGLRVLTGLGEHYRGPVYEALLAEYRDAARGRMARMVAGARTCARRLHVAADVIAGMQNEVVEELAALAADEGRPVADRAAAAEKQIAYLQRQLEHYALDQVSEVAADQLAAIVAEASRGPERPRSAELLAALDRGEDLGPEHRFDPAEVERCAVALDRHEDRLRLAAERFRTCLAAVDFAAPPGPDDALVHGFLLDRGAARAVFGADGMVTLDGRSAAAVAHRPSRVFLREVGLPDDAAFLALQPELRWGEVRIGGADPAASGGADRLALGRFGADDFHLDTVTGRVHNVPDGGPPQLAATRIDAFVLALHALEAERPFYETGLRYRDHLDPAAVERRFTALLRRVDPEVAADPDGFWRRLMGHLHNS